METPSYEKMPPLPEKNVLLWVAGAVTLLLFLVYGSTLNHDFVRWDDTYLIYENPAVSTISLTSLKTIFTTYDPELYIPLTLLSYQVDYLIGSGDAWIFHLTNLLLHTINGLLVMWFLYRLSGRSSVALIAGVLFAVHPLNTEAVAWASARKDLLATMFFLSSIITYLYAVPTRRKSLFWLSVGLFVLGLLSKVVILTLPVILLLLDYLLGRKFSTKLLLEKVPYFLLSIIFGIVALFGKREIIEGLSPFQNSLLSIKSIVFALQKLIIPYPLMPTYPYTQEITLSSPDFWIPIVILIPLLIGTFLTLRWTKKIFIWVLFFLITIAPTVLNLIKQGDVYVFSDRYAYIPSIGLFFLVSSGVIFFLDRETDFRRAHNKAKIMSSIGIIVIIALGILSYRQSKIWQGSEVLFTHVLRFYPNSLASHLNLGNVYRGQGKIDEAIAEYEKALEIAPREKVYVNLAEAHRKQGALSKAVENYDKAKSLNPNSADVFFGMGLVYSDQGKYDDAFTSYAKALEINPAMPDVYLNRGSLYLKQGNENAALEQYEKSIEVDPSFAQGYYNLGVLLSKKNQIEEAIALYEKAVQQEPRLISARINLGILYAETGDLDGAEGQFKKILSMDPNNAAAKSAIEQIRAAKLKR